MHCGPLNQNFGWAHPVVPRVSSKYLVPLKDQTYGMLLRLYVLVLTADEDADGSGRVSGAERRVRRTRILSLV